MRHLLVVLGFLLSASFAAFAQTPATADTRTQNVILVVTDGLRWQEVFGGADSMLVFGDPRRLGGETAVVSREILEAGAAARREVLLPFLWGTVAREGQIFGNRAGGSSMAVTNGLKFSIPLQRNAFRFVDPRIDRNDFGPNPNVTVFEWLNRQPRLRGRVAAYATWDAFADIFARQRTGVMVHAGWEPPYATPRSASDSLLNRLYATTFRMWDNNAYDSFTHAVAMRDLEARRPRVVFIGYGIPMTCAFRPYDRLLGSRARWTATCSALSFAQTQPGLSGRTTLIVTTDHAWPHRDRLTDHAGCGRRR